MNLKDLSKHYKVYVIDFLGFGSSSRCKFDIKDAKTTIDFIVQKIDLFRKALNINKLYLLGHSLGGCMAGCYTLKHP